MKGIFVPRWSAVLAAAVAFLAVQTAMAQTAVLESSALRLELNGGPYSYSVIDKTTGAVLAIESQTQFTVAGVARSVVAASVTGQTDNTLDATLAFAGTSDTAATLALTGHAAAGIGARGKSSAGTTPA